MLWQNFIGTHPHNTDNQFSLSLCPPCFFHISWSVHNLSKISFCSTTKPPYFLHFTYLLLFRMTFATYQNFLDQGSLVSLLCPPSSLPTFALSFTHSFTQFASLRMPTIRRILSNWQACHSSWWIKRLLYLIPWRLNIYHVA